MSHNIISFSGRLGSGKTELASICEQYGYKKLYFALPLKQLCADLLDVSIDELNILKRNNTPINITVGKDWVDIIHETTNIPFDNVNKMIGGKTIQTVRELLQVVGTDVIRTYNPHWHVQQIESMIDPNEKYVIDDVRFPNEKAMVEKLNGICWYIIRPILSNVSNHESETALDWRQFDNIIVNNKTLTYLKYHWEVFMSKGHDESLEQRRNVYINMVGHDDVVGKLGDLIINNEDEKTFTLKDALFIHEDEFKYTPKFINNINVKSVEERDNDALVTYNDDTYEKVTNIFQIEDLKKYI